ncbi:hypothetical protein QZH41_002315 [Actinostola sp. cb2023]|nr:hypothetical protein QZH41_002315 [Actinostola sp. cb2023]
MAPGNLSKTPPSSPTCSPPRKKAKFSLRLKGKSKSKTDNDDKNSKASNIYAMFHSPVQETESSSNDIVAEPVLPSIPLAGLINRANTCYANAVLQVLRCCPGFQQFLDHLAKDIKMIEDATENNKDMNIEPKQLVTHLSKLLGQMYSYEVDFLNDKKNCNHLRNKGPMNLVLAAEPHDFMAAFRELYPAFECNLQHDAQEFLCSLIMALQESDASVIKKLFQGKLVHQTKCLNCEQAKLRLSSKITSNLQTPFTLSVQEWCSKKCQLENNVYELFGIVLHSGMTSGSGHYETYVRVPQTNQQKQNSDILNNGNGAPNLNPANEITNGLPRHGENATDHMQNGIANNDIKVDINRNSVGKTEGNMSDSNVSKRITNKKLRTRKAKKSISELSVDESGSSLERNDEEGKTQESQDCAEDDPSPFQAQGKGQASCMSLITKYFHRSKKVSSNSSNNEKCTEQSEECTRNANMSNGNTDNNSVSKELCEATDDELKEASNPKVCRTIEDSFKKINSMKQSPESSKSPTTCIRKLHFMNGSDDKMDKSESASHENIENLDQPLDECCDCKTADDFLQLVKRNNPGENEFHQAVEEVVYSIWDYLKAHPEYLKDGILERLVEPERVIMFRVPWRDDKGKVHINKGYRVQFSSAIGPYKGGLRFHPTVNLSILKFLGFEQVLKNSLTTLSMGGGKGGSNFDPKGKTDAEVMSFCQSFMTELQRHIGPNTDVPAGDIGVGGREIGFLFGQYKRLRNEFTGVLTGKGMSFGGSVIRPEATGYGLLYFVDEMLKANGKSLKDKIITISGAGNVAQYATEKAIQLGGKVVSLSDSNGTVYDPNGIDSQKLAFVMELKNVKRGRIQEYAEKYKVEYHEGKRPWFIKCDVALPCATQNEVSKEDAEMLVKNGCSVVAEGANMPTSPEAIKVFHARKVLFAPGKASNAGGVAVSGLEMSQNSERQSWTSEQVDQKLRGIMKAIHGTCLKYGSAGDGYVDYVKGANIGGFVKIANAMAAQGIV